MSIHYHFQTETQPGRSAFLPADTSSWREESSARPLAVRYVQRLTGASLSTARLYAELAGLSTVAEAL